MRTTREFLALNRLFTTIVSEQVGGTVPLPGGVESLVQGGAESQLLPDEAGRWVAVLDLCLTPQLFRMGIQKQAPDEETLTAVIRYLVTKKPRLEADRDRLDWLLTHIFRRRAAAGSMVGFGAVRESIQNWLHGTPYRPLTDVAQNLLSEVAAAVGEVSEMRSFDRLTESGLIQRGRVIKESFQEEFFHPEVLPAVVNYNLVVGQRFQSLFSQAAEQARELAAGLAEKEYRSASEDFRRLGSAVKEEKEEKGRPVSPREPEPVPAPPPPPPAVALPGDPLERMKALGIDPSRQATKLKHLVADIAGFARSAGRAIESIPLPHGPLPVWEWEAAALRAEYPSEDQSFRAEFNRRIHAAIGYVAAMQEEMVLYHEKRGNEYLWKPHYDALLYLLYHGRQELLKLEDLAHDTRSRGLTEKADQVARTAEKLRTHLGRVSQIF